MGERVLISETWYHVFKGTSAWRGTTAARFPDDAPRNLRAAETLNKLATESANLTDQQWLCLKSYFGGWASETWRNALTQTARQVGFFHRCRDLDSFISVLTHQLSQSNVAAA
jgi:hypothetical protein